jgi:hypothetical protein
MAFLCQGPTSPLLYASIGCTENTSAVHPLRLFPFDSTVARLVYTSKCPIPPPSRRSWTTLPGQARCTECAINTTSGPDTWIRRLGCRPPCRTGGFVLVVLALLLLHSTLPPCLQVLQQDPAVHGRRPTSGCSGRGSGVGGRRLVGRLPNAYQDAHRTHAG